MFWMEFIIWSTLSSGLSSIASAEMGILTSMAASTSRLTNTRMFVFIIRSPYYEDFTSRQGLLLNILMRVALLNGTLTYEFPDLYEGKLALFKHHEKDTSDWVKNGIENLL